MIIIKADSGVAPGERGHLMAESEKGIDLGGKEFRREGKEKHLPGSRVQTGVSSQYRRGVLGLGNYLHPKYAFFYMLQT